MTGFNSRGRGNDRSRNKNAMAGRRDGVIMKRGSEKHKKLRTVLSIFLGLSILFLALILFTDFYKIFLKPLDIGESINRDFGDVILVLGGGLRPGVEIGFSTEERLNLAAELYRQKKRMMIISDGSLYKNSPAIKKIKRYLLDRGVEENHIFLEGNSQTTFDSGINSLKIIQAENFRQVVVCTSPYHQRRSHMILGFIGYQDYRIARMRQSEIYSSGSLRQRLRNIKLILRDYFAIIKFKIFRH